MTVDLTHPVLSVKCPWLDFSPFVLEPVKGGTTTAVRKTGFYHNVSIDTTCTWEYYHG